MAPFIERGSNHSPRHSTGLSPIDTVRLVTSSLWACPIVSGSKTSKQVFEIAQVLTKLSS